MKAFRDKVAVITGAASGIGEAIARRCAVKGMRVVLADIEADALKQIEKEIKSGGGDVCSMVTDVSQKADVEALAQKTMDVYGAVHLLCNNAGVGAGSTVWGTSINDWEWTLSVNFWGVIHGLQVFVPIMLEQDAESHIVNTSSIAGLLPYHGSAPYHVSKHAVVALSEKMFYDLGENSARVKVSVLCPGWVKTRILESDRNRPAEFQDDPSENFITPEMVTVMMEYQQAVETGMPADRVADQVFQAIQEDRFYILTHPEYLPIVEARMQALIKESNPLPRAKLVALSEG